MMQAKSYPKTKNIKNKAKNIYKDVKNRCKK